jgi:hypothetical protein
MPVLPISAPVVPGDTRSAGHVGAGIPTTDQKAGGSSPSGRTIGADQRKYRRHGLLNVSTALPQRPCRMPAPLGVVFCLHELECDHQVTVVRQDGSRRCCGWCGRRTRAAWSSGRPGREVERLRSQVALDDLAGDLAESLVTVARVAV